MLLAHCARNSADGVKTNYIINTHTTLMFVPMIGIRFFDMFIISNINFCTRKPGISARMCMWWYLGEDCLVSQTLIADDPSNILAVACIFFVYVTTVSIMLTNCTFFTCLMSSSAYNFRF